MTSIWSSLEGETRWIEGGGDLYGAFRRFRLLGSETASLSLEVEVELELAQRRSFWAPQLRRGGREKLWRVRDLSGAIAAIYDYDHDHDDDDLSLCLSLSTLSLFSEAEITPLTKSSEELNPLDPLD